MEKEVFALVDQAIVNGTTEEALRILNAARDRLRRASNGTCTAIHRFYRDHAHILTIDERKWMGHIMAQASRGFVRYKDAKVTNEMAKAYGLAPFL